MLVCSETAGSTVFDKSQYKILIVEDSTFVSKLLFDAFSEYGYSVECSQTLSETRSILSRSRFDLIVLDLHLSDGDSDTLIEEMREVNETKIIVLTADDDKMTRDHIFQQGVLDYFNKDNKLPLTINIINNLLEEIHLNRFASILIIDDSSLVRQLLTTLLAPRNYQIRTASTGTDGLKMLKEQPFDLVILDIELPDTHGTKVLNKIKSDPVTMQTEVIVLSGTSDPNILSSVLKQGACNFIKKPFAYEEIIHSVDTWISFRREKNKVTCQQHELQAYQDAIYHNYIVSVTDPEGIITFASDGFCKVSGYSREELVGKSHNIIRHPDEDPAVFEDLWETIKSKKPWTGTLRNQAKDGRTYYVDIAINPILNYDGTIKEYLAIRHDITEMTKLHKELNDELQLTTSSFEEANNLAKKYERALLDTNLIVRTDTMGIISYINKSFTEVTGFTLSDLQGKDMQILFRESSRDKYTNEIKKAFDNGTSWKGEISGVSAANTQYFLTSTATPITNNNGKIEEYLFINHDITQIKTLNKELQEKDAMINMQSRHAAMGEMLSMITHQWKQPLSTMSAISSRMQMDVALEKVEAENLNKYAKTIEEQIRYLSQTIDDFKNFFQPAKNKEISKISDVIEQTIRLIGKLLTSEQIDVTLNMNSTSMINIYAKELLQVLINLLKNAADAFEDKSIEHKNITITTEEDDEYVTIKIEDNAGGIPDKALEHIFEPYFTTKPDDKGTGLGLHICKTIIQKHMNGEISVSNLEDGASFLIKLPR